MPAPFALPADACAPPLMWSEAMTTVHSIAWRRQVTATDASAWMDRVRALPIARRDPAALQRTAWDLADELGWAKTYDAEYLALARLQGCLLLTIDARLRRGAERTGLVRLPDEL